jgi:hypothetical protein
MGSENGSGSGIILASNIGELDTLSKRIAKSNLVPAPYRDKPDDIYVAMLMGNELGIGPMQAIQNIDVIEGRPSSRSRLKKTLAMKHPACEYFIMVESTDAKATYETKKRGDPHPVRLTYTIEQATKAGLLRKANWAGHPAAMLRARCEGQLADIVFSDATLGLPPDEYVDFEESAIGEPVASATKVVDVTTGQPEVTKGTSALKETIAKKKDEKKSEVQDALFTDDKKPDAKPSPPKEEPVKSGNFTVTKNEDGSESLKREAKKDEKPAEVTNFVKPPPPVGEQVPPKVEPLATSETGTAKVQPEKPKEEFDIDMTPPANADMTTWYYECCLALAKLRGLDSATLKAELKAVGAKGPKTVTKEHFETLGKKYPPAKVEAPSTPAREPGDDSDAIAEEKRQNGDLF